MRTLTFRCPRTEAIIDSGIETDHETLRNLQRIGLRVRCPHCGRAHAFTAGEGTFTSAA
ncbi:MAG: hypothetical protein AB7K64_12300 [Variibacter sp.]